MRFLGYAARFVVIGFVLWWFLVAYTFGRIGTLFIRDKEERRRATAALRGRVLRRAMTALGATFVKLGQVLSTRPDLLEPETIAELRQLQDRLPAFPMQVVRRIVEQDLGAPLEDRFAEFDVTPVAAASVAQVHRARLKDGSEVAVKILRPDARQRIKRDAAILGMFARMIAWHPSWRLSDPVGHLDDFFSGILNQTDLRLEVANYDLFRAHFATTEGVRFPRVHPLACSERVMTMEFLRGTKVDALPPGDHRKVAARLQHVILKMCFEDGFVHADLHPGNMLVHESGDIAIFDVGLVKHLGEDVLLQCVDFTKCLVLGAPQDFVLHLKRFHTYTTNVDWVALEKDMADFIARFRGKNVGELELGGLMNDIFAIARRYRVRPVPDMALVIVGLVTAEGIGKQLHPDSNLFEDTAAFLMPLLAKRGLGLAGSA